jgi:prolyl 4-hydroxylase
MLPESSFMKAIDWSRLAEPQADQYDTSVALGLASATTSASRPEPYRRTAPGNSPAVFDGQVAVRYVYDPLPEFKQLSEQFPNAPLDHRNIARAVEYVRTWPTAFTQCQHLLEAIHPALHPQMPVESRAVYRGSLCHSYERLFGTMWATIFCPVGLAESIVHEMAHQKLRVLGVSFESATNVVGNSPSELFVSPVIKDRLRPLMAVLHAEYSYVYVTTLDIHILQAERDPARRKVFESVLERNLARIEEGYGTLKSHFKPGEHGAEFMRGFFAWTDRTIESARDLLAKGDSSGLKPVQAPTSKTGAENGAKQTAALKRLPDIHTGASTIRTPDRNVEVLLTFKSPRIVVLGNVLSDEECDALTRYCEPRLTRSSVLAGAEGAVEVHPNRTSSGAELRREETAVVSRIEARLAALAQWPAECSEGLQVLRYGVTEEYKPHFDWIPPDMPGLKKHLEVAGQRLGTFVLYLSDVEAGGGTSFPSIGLEVMPQKGGAVFFVNTDSNLVPDQLTLHAGSPVVKGVKYIANKWLRERTC